ncbi:MAG TPA: FAD-binding oxidoreductase, partial [Solirubrobacteraceae bacterium]
MRTGELGYWWRSLGGPPPARAPLAESTEADVAIVGAGYTGLWTAYYLKRAQPSLRVVVLEAEQAGFGASGRNGGWVTPFFSGPASAYERRGGRAALIALQRAML